MPARLGRGEPVEVQSLGPGGIPSRFTFRGRRYRVRSVAARPDFGRRLKGQDRTVEWMEVRTESGMRAVLSRGSKDNRWRMEGIL